MRISGARLRPARRKCGPRATRLGSVQRENLSRVRCEVKVGQTKSKTSWSKTITSRRQKALLATIDRRRFVGKMRLSDATEAIWNSRSTPPALMTRVAFGAQARAAHVVVGFHPEHKHNGPARQLCLCSHARGERGQPCRQVSLESWSASPPLPPADACDVGVRRPLAPSPRLSEVTSGLKLVMRKFL